MSNSQDIQNQYIFWDITILFWNLCCFKICKELGALVFFALSLFHISGTPTIVNPSVVATGSVIDSSCKIHDSVSFANSKSSILGLSNKAPIFKDTFRKLVKMDKKWTQSIGGGGLIDWTKKYMQDFIFCLLIPKKQGKLVGV